MPIHPRRSIERSVFCNFAPRWLAWASAFSAGLAGVLAACDPHHRSQSGRDAAVDASSMHDADASANRDAGAPIEAPALAMGCSTSSQLMAAAMVAMTTPDPYPVNVKLASSESGAKPLATWSDGGGSLNGTTLPQSLWAAGVSLGSSGPAAQSATQLADDGNCLVAAATSDGFAVVWTAADGRHLQRLDPDGTPTAKSQVTPIDDPDACSRSLLDTTDGLVITWYEPGTGNQFVARLDPKGGVADSAMLDPIPKTTAAASILASFEGQTFVATGRWTNASSTSISRIDWSTPSTTMQTEVTGYPLAFFAGADNLVLAVDDADGFALYAGAPGEAQRAWAHETRGLTAVADACGRIVALGSGDPTPAGFAMNFFADALDPAGSQASLGTAVTEAALVGAGSQFGVLWYSRSGTGDLDSSGSTSSAPGTLNFTTLTWQ